MTYNYPIGLNGQEDNTYLIKKTEHNVTELSQFKLLKWCKFEKNWCEVFKCSEFF